ncbi:TraR/DksA C4-type zinc finger protein [Shimia sp. SDUM112013]|uniref:TraR/DksA family transcriptional regulator n=1 Tax=Shimia sp. SDUM112013 TaxID=3136160 RepID=UPI0032EF6793
MNEKDKLHLRAVILEKLAALTEENRLGQEAQAVVTLDQQAVGRLSRMDALQSQAMAKANQTRRDALAKALEAALARINTEDFGYCEDCGEEIALKRLEFDPAALRCISCAAG